MVKFSIIVPIYNIEKYIKKCIQSILKQTYKNFELILVDDGSTDSCGVICDEFLKKDDRIKVIHKTNGGLVSARNEGLNNSSGEYICYVDGDDWIEKNTLEILYKILKKENPDVIVFNLKKIFKEKVEILPFWNENGLYDKIKLERNIYPYMMCDIRKKFCTPLIFPTGAGKIFRRSLLKEHYCKDLRIRMGEDNAFVYETLYSANSVYFINEPLYCYNQTNNTSITSTYDKKRFKNNLILFNYMENNLNLNYINTKEQFNLFKAYWIIMAVFHEIKTKQKTVNSVKHLRKELKTTHILSKVSIKGIPLFAKAYIIALRIHLFFSILLLTKVVIGVKDE